MSSGVTPGDDVTMPKPDLDHTTAPVASLKANTVPPVFGAMMRPDCMIHGDDLKAAEAVWDHLRVTTGPGGPRYQV
jgi:hypothetical protein